MSASSTTSISVDHEILELWESCDLIGKLLLNNKDKPVFKFIDGPPFVSSENLHYGHLLVSFIKSCVLNYKQMTGFKTENKLGYDCHGLPIEMVVNQILGVKTRQDVFDLGVSTYNDKCKQLIQQFSSSWEHIYRRIGRFADFSNQYKTIDTDFMEQVWSSFKQLFEKDLIYKGYKIMPYSVACATALSNFEAGQNYKTVEDCSAFVAFDLLEGFDDKSYQLIAWTTTPWTLPSNVALAVNPDLDYLILEIDCNSNCYQIVCKDCIKNLYPEKKQRYKIIDVIKGSVLNNKKYKPLFNYIQHSDYRVVTDKFVDVTTGTGVVHLAPAFGEIDFEICTKLNLCSDVDSCCLIDDNGLFKPVVTQFANLNVFDANPLILESLKATGHLIKKMMYKHSYPFCWRTDTPLIYKAMSSYFVKVEALKDRMIELNDTINWSPPHIGTSRFKNWLENTKDWSISRSRFFGTPIPLWVSDDLEEVVCVGSVQELFELTGVKLNDLHREHVDNLTIESKLGKGKLKRIDDVFDCWFESGTVPLINNNDNNIANFVCEGVDQTRGWFYTTLIESTAVLDTVPFKNCICAGLILAEDGKKFSKRLNNFVPPQTVLDKYGADALRLYLVGSPAANAESFKFSEEGVQLINRKLYQFYNGCKLYVNYLTKYEKDGYTFDKQFYKKSDKPVNVMDQWILSKVGSICDKIRLYMDSYKVYKVPKQIFDFIEELTNWYIKFNRNRLRGRKTVCDRDEQHVALSVLYNVIFQFCLICAPFTPFLTEKINLMINSDIKSVHLYDYPNSSDFITNINIQRKMHRLQNVCRTVRALRTQTKVATSSKVPLKQVTISTKSQQFIEDLKELEQYMYDEINCLHVEYSSYIETVYKVEPNSKQLGQRYKTLSRKIKDQIELIEPCSSPIESVVVTVDDVQYDLKPDEYTVTTNTYAVSNLNCNSSNSTLTPNSTVSLIVQDSESLNNFIIVTVDYEQTEEIVLRVISRLFTVEVQNMRKMSNLQPWNKIKIYYETDDQLTLKAIKTFKNKIVEDLLYEIYNEPPHSDEQLVVQETRKVRSNDIIISLTS